MIQQVRYDVGGVITFDPAQAGNPTSATAAVYDPGGAVHITPAPTVTIDGVDTTLSHDEAVGQYTVRLTSAADVEAGRYYTITSADGPVHWVRVASIDGTTVTLFEPLTRHFMAGDKFEGNRLELSISAGAATPLDEGYEVRLEYVIDGETYYANITYDVVRSPWPETILAPYQFRQLVPNLAGSWLERTDADGLQFADEIANATERVREDIIDRGYRPDLFRSFDSFRRVVALRVCLQWAEDGVNIPDTFQDTPQEWLDERQEQYITALTRALNTAKSYDANDSGTVTDDERAKKIGARRVVLA